MTTNLNQSQVTPVKAEDAFVVRPMRSDNEKDLEALVKLYNEADAAYQIGLISGRETLEAGLREKLQVITPSPLLVVEHPEAGERFVGTLSVEPKLESGRNLFFMHGLVHPAWTSQGVGVRLVREAMRLISEAEGGVAAIVEPVAPELPANIVFTVSGSMPHKEELVREFGLEPERYYAAFYRDDLENVVMPELPSNFSLRSFRLGQDEAEYTAAFNDSYFSNWGYSAATVERVVYGWQRPPSDPEKLLLIWDDEANKIVSFARLRVKAETTHLHEGRGEVAWIGSRSDYQRHGLGNAVLLAALTRLRDKYNFKGAAAVVDVPAANPEPITQFFKRAGFYEEISRRITICRREI